NVTVRDLILAKVQDNVDDTEPPSIVLGFSEQATLSTDRATAPTNPFNGETPIPTVEGVFTAIVTEVGLAERVKSARIVTMTVTVGERERHVLVTVTVTVMILATLQEQVSDEEPDTEVPGAGERTKQ